MLVQDKKKLSISIVTICFNAADELEKTISSVRHQKSVAEFEYLIIDGGSTDGTSDLVSRNSDVIDVFVSESDEGISDAFNKGVSASSKQWILMLNAGDEFSRDFSLIEIQNELSSAADIIFFKVEVGEARFIPPLELNGDLDLILHNVSVPHQAAFVRKKLYEKIGGYMLAFKIRMDYEFFLRSLSYGASFDYHDRLIVKYMEGGVSMRPRNRLRFNFEKVVADYLYSKTKVVKLSLIHRVMACFFIISR